MALLLMLGLMSLYHVSVVRGSHLWAASPRYMASIVYVVHGLLMMFLSQPGNVQASKKIWHLTLKVPFFGAAISV